MICLKWVHAIVSAVRNNLGVGERLSEADHVPQGFLAETAPVVGFQLSPHCGDNLRPVTRPVGP